jgi:hypothetical protein
LHRPVVGNATNIDPAEKAVLGVERQIAFNQHGKQLATDVEFATGRNEVDRFRFENVPVLARVDRASSGFGFSERTDATIIIGPNNAVVLTCRLNIKRHHAGNRAFLLVLGQGSANIEIDDGISTDNQRCFVKNPLKS